MAILEKAVLAILTIGSTHYVDIGQDTDAVIYYADESRVHMVLPGGPQMNGDWHLLPNGYHVKWENGPEGDWKISYEPGVLTYIDSDGKSVGTVTRLVPGNPENFR